MVRQKPNNNIPIFPKRKSFRIRVQSGSQKSESFYRSLIQTLTDVVVVTDRFGIIQFTSMQAKNIFGLRSNDENAVNSIFDWIDPKDQRQVELDFQNVIAGLPCLGSQYRLIRADGSSLIGDVRAILFPEEYSIVPRLIITIRDVTDRKHTELELRKLSRAVEQSPACIIITDVNGVVEYVNPKFFELTGYTSEEVIGKNPSILKSGFTPEYRYPVLWNTILSGKEWRGEFCNKKKNGDLYWESASISPVVDEAGRITHFVAVKIDITNQKIFESALFESESRFRGLFEASADGIILLDEQGTIIACNSAMEQILGIACESIIGSTGWDFYERILSDDPDRSDKFQLNEENVLQILQTGQSPILGQIIDIVLQRPNGKRLFISQKLFAIKTNRGYRLGSITRDISGQKQAEQALRESEARFRTLIESAPIPISISKDLKFIYANPMFQKMGRPEDDKNLIGQHILNRLAFQHQVKVDESQPLIESGSPVSSHYEITAKRGDGIDLPMIVDATTVDLAEGPATVAFYTDITDRKQAEEALIQEKSFITSVLESLPGIFFLLDEDRNLVRWNKKFEEFSGYSSTDLSQWHLYNSLTDTDRIYVEQNLHNLSAEGVIGIELAPKMKNGEQIPLFLSVKQLVLDSKTYILGIGIDITERKQREHELKAITSISSRLRSNETLEEMLPVILEEMVGLLQADTAQIDIIDPITNDAVVVSTYGMSALPKGYRIPPDLGLNTYIRSSLKPYLNNNANTDPMVLDPFRVDYSGAIAGVPMIAQGQLLGFLWIGRKSSITQKDIHPLIAIADIAANAIRRTVLHEQTNQRLKQLTALRRIDLAINTNNDLQSALKVLIDETLTQLNVDAANLLLLDEDTQTFNIIFGSGFQTALSSNLQIPVRESLAQLALMQKSFVQVESLDRSNAPDKLKQMAKEEGFVSYYAAPLIKEGKVKGVLEAFLSQPTRPDPDWQAFFEALAGQAAIVIDNKELFQRLIQSNQKLANAYEATIEGWSAAMDLRDHETEGHTQRVTELTLKLAQAMGILPSEQIYLRRGALLHDIGKIGIPDAILLKKDRLTHDELIIMRKHPQLAYDMLAKIEYLLPALDIPYCHHEKWDGSGYPRRLRRLQIPLAARIFTIADVWDALTTNRPYRLAWSKEKALDYIQRKSGKHFDPQIVQVFMRLINPVIQ